MQTVKVTTKDLIAVLKSNRAAHAKEYETALAGYHGEAMKAAKKLLAQVRAHQDVTIFLPPKPQHHLDDYDRCIQMAEASADQTVSLTAAEFAQYWMDQWGWMRDFKTTAAFYTDAAQARR